MMDGTAPAVDGAGGGVRVTGAGVAVLAVLALTACGPGGEQPTAPTSAAPARPSATTSRPVPPATSPTASPVDTATADPSTSPNTTPPAPVAPLTDYGSALSVWAPRHTADERFDPGAMWDPTPGWGPDEDHDAKFNDLVVTAGRVLDYVEYLPRGGVPAARATSIALATLPRDSTVLWKQQFAACSVVQLTSASLAKVVAGKPFSNPDGQVQLVLRSGSPVAPSATPRLDPARITQVAVRAKTAATAADFPGC
jgi:hypothetical protein